jgi:hypothetical protein
MSVPGAEEILSQGILHVPARFVHERCQKKIPAVLNRRYSNEDYAGYQSGFACHRFSFIRGNLELLPIVLLSSPITRMIGQVGHGAHFEEVSMKKLVPIPPDSLKRLKKDTNGG